MGGYLDIRRCTLRTQVSGQSLMYGPCKYFFFFKEKRKCRRRARSKVQEWIEVVRKNELFEKYYKVSTVLISER